MDAVTTKRLCVPGRPARRCSHPRAGGATTGSNGTSSWSGACSWVRSRSWLRCPHHDDRLRTPVGPSRCSWISWSKLLRSRWTIESLPAGDTPGHRSASLCFEARPKGFVLGVPNQRGCEHGEHREREGQDDPSRARVVRQRSDLCWPPTMRVGELVPRSPSTRCLSCTPRADGEIPCWRQDLHERQGRVGSAWSDCRHLGQLAPQNMTSPSRCPVVPRCRPDNERVRFEFQRSRELSWPGAFSRSRSRRQASGRRSRRPVQAASGSCREIWAPLTELVLQDHLGQRVLDASLDQAAAARGHRSPRRIPPAPAPCLTPLTRTSRWIPSRLQEVGHFLEHPVRNAAADLDVQRVEHHHLVDAVDELRTEALPHAFQRGFLDVVLVDLRGRCPGSPCATASASIFSTPRLLVMMTTVPGEGHHLALAVGEDALVQELQQQVVDLGVRLLDLVEQHHAVLFLASPPRSAGRPRCDRCSRAANRSAWRIRGAAHTRSSRCGPGGRDRHRAVRARALASSVLPVPVRPTNKKVPTGTPGALQANRRLLHRRGQAIESVRPGRSPGCFRATAPAPAPCGTAALRPILVVRPCGMSSLGGLAVLGSGRGGRQAHLVDLQVRVHVDADLVEQLLDDLQVVVLIQLARDRREGSRCGSPERRPRRSDGGRMPCRVTPCNLQWKSGEQSRRSN